MIKGLLVLALLAPLALGAMPAAADEVKTPVSASMLLTIMSTPVEARDTAYNRALMDAPPAARPSIAEVLPDGSVKIDRAVVTVRNPCPPGHVEPGQLPGRKVKN
jgi:hypothetical protein